MKYTTIKKNKSGRTWVFTPPEDVVVAGLIKEPQVFHDGRSARYAIPRLLRSVEDFRKGVLAGDTLVAGSTLSEILAFYQQHDRFDYLAKERELGYLLQASPQLRLFDLNGPTVSKEYRRWCRVHGPNFANKRLSTLSVLCRFLMLRYYLTHNPCDQVDKVPSVTGGRHREEVLWTREQIKAFIDTCFTQFKWTSAGLVALLTFYTLQSVSSVSAMTWEQVDFEKKELSFPKAKVTIPVPDNVLDVLKQQKEMWDFQPYVMPYHRATDNAYRPFKHTQSIQGALKAGGLPEGLKLGSLQASVIRQLLDEGKDPSVLIKTYGLPPRTVLKVCNKEHLHVEKRQDLHLHQLQIPRL